MAPLRQEWIETSPEVSYRFVVSLDVLRAADSVARAALRKRKSWWQRAFASFMRDILRLIVGALVVAFLGWFSLRLALVVDGALDATQRYGSGALVPIVIFLIVFLPLLAGFRVAVQRAATPSFERVYREFYSDNEFLLEGRKSHLWFEERSTGAIRRWSSIEQLVEFEDGMWLFLRQTTYAGRRVGLLISKENLSPSCTWSELTVYLRQRIEEAGGEAGHAVPE